MATRTYLDVDGDWNNTANWSGGPVPTTGDIVIIGDSSRTIDTNMNQAAAALNRLVILDSFTGNIGASGNPLLIDVTNGTLPKFMIENSGTASQIWWEGSATLVSVRSTSTDADGVHLDGGTTTRLIISSGNVTLHSGMTATTVIVSRPDVGVTEPDVTIQSSVTMTTLTCGGGTLTTASAPTTLQVTGGVVTQTGSGNVTTIRVFAGQFLSEINAATTYTTVDHFGGLVDLGGLDAALTITNTTIYSNAARFVGSPVGLVTYTNTPSIAASAPTFSYVEAAAFDG